MPDSTSYSNVVRETFGSWQQRFEAELHNAFVAGLERTIDSIDIKELVRIAKCLKEYKLNPQDFGGSPTFDFLYDQGVKIEKALGSSRPAGADERWGDEFWGSVAVREMLGGVLCDAKGDARAPHAGVYNEYIDQIINKLRALQNS